MLQFYILQDDRFVKDDTFNDMYSDNTNIFESYPNRPSHAFYGNNSHGWQLRDSILKSMMENIERNWDESRFFHLRFSKYEFLEKWKHVYDVCGRHDNMFLRMKWVEE